MRTILRLLVRSLPTVCGLLFGIGLVIRLTLKDGWRASAALYYATPPAMLACVALLGGYVAWRRKRQAFAVLLLAAGAASLCWHFADNLRFQSAAPVNRSMRVVFWNAAHGSLGFDGVVETLRDTDADVIGVVEAGVDGPATLAAWQRAFPDYTLSRLVGETLLLTKGSISPDQHGTLGYASMFKRVDIEVDNQKLRIYLVDLCSSILRDRGSPIRRLRKLLAADDGRPVLVMGDFNTPGDSVHFKAMRESFANAFEVAGDGYASTWPTPLPCIQIDHVWANRQVTIDSCHHGWSWHSDHRPIVLDVRVKATSPKPVDH